MPRHTTTEGTEAQLGLEKNGTESELNINRSSEPVQVLVYLVRARLAASLSILGLILVLGLLRRILYRFRLLLARTAGTLWKGDLFN